MLWKHDTLPGHVAIATMVNWRWTGYNALILLAAMQAVPRDIYEAGAIDGAGAFRRFFSITLPSIRPTFIFVLITATIGGLQIFTEPKLFDATRPSPGGAYHQFETTILYIWNMAFNQDHFGDASAIAFILLLIIVAIGLVNYFLSKRIAIERGQGREQTHDPSSRPLPRRARSRRRRRPGSLPEIRGRGRELPGAAVMSTATIEARHRRAPSAPRRIHGSRPGFLVYGLLLAWFIGSAYPLWWSFVVGIERQLRPHGRLPSPPAGRTVLDERGRGASTTDRLLEGARPTASSSRRVITVSVLFFSTLAGYAFAKLRFRGRNGLLLFVIATLAVPTQLGIIPLFILMSEFGWTGSLGAVIVPTLVTAFGVFFMRQYLVDVIPDELIEAARVDGATMIGTFWHVGVPAARPAMAVLGLFTFMTAWTDYLWPLIVAGSNPTLQVALSQLQSARYVDYSIVLTGAVLATIPLLILFVVAGRQLISGIMAGAVKG